MASLACLFGLILGPAQHSSAQDLAENMPIGPFKTVHLLTVNPAEAESLAKAVVDLNQELHSDGCTSCEYKLFSLFAGNSGRPNFMLTGDWPSRVGYLKAHASADYAAANKRNPVLERLYAAEYYGRFVEVRK